jgi:predicted TPR repeat methyltransferase
MEPARRVVEANTYWIERSRELTGVAAITPDSRWVRYHGWTNRMLRRWTLSRLDRPRFRRCVDIGCGLGDWSVALAPRCDEMYGCDVADPFVKLTRERLDELGHTSWNVEQADVRGYRLPHGIDLAYFGAVLMYLDDRDVGDVLYRLRQHTVNNALVIIRDYCTFNLGREGRGPGHCYHRTPDALIDIANLAGLECIEARSSQSIYAEVMGNSITRWPLAALWRLATLHWTRASHTFVFRA